MTVTEILERMVREYNLHSYLKVRAQGDGNLEKYKLEKAKTSSLSMYITELSLVVGDIYQSQFGVTEYGLNYHKFVKAK